jgi:hypothetical protein
MVVFYLFKNKSYLSLADKKGRERADAVEGPLSDEDGLLKSKIHRVKAKLDYGSDVTTSSVTSSLDPIPLKTVMKDLEWASHILVLAIYSKIIAMMPIKSQSLPSWPCQPQITWGTWRSTLRARKSSQQVLCEVIIAVYSLKPNNYSSVADKKGQERAEDAEGPPNNHTPIEDHLAATVKLFPKPDYDLFILIFPESSSKKVVGEHYSYPVLFKLRRLLGQWIILEIVPLRKKYPTWYYVDGDGVSLCSLGSLSSFVIKYF